MKNYYYALIAFTQNISKDSNKKPCGKRAWQKMCLNVL